MAIKITNHSMADDVREYVKELPEVDKIGIKYFFAGLALGRHEETDTEGNHKEKEVPEAKKESPKKQEAV